MEGNNQGQSQGAGGEEGLSSLLGQQSENQASQQQTGGGTGESGGHSEHVTRAEIEQIKAEAIKEARRTAQSISDKAASVSRKAYQQAMDEISQLKSDGIELTPAQEQKIRDRKLSQLTSDNGGGEQQGQPQQQNIDQQTQSQAVKPPIWLESRINKLAQETGFGLLPTDPEVEGAGLTTQLMQSDPMSFYEKYQETLAAKAERIKTGGGQPRRGMTPGNGTGGSGPTGLRGLEAEYKQKVQEARGNARKIRDLRKEYQDKGLDTSSVKFDY